MIVILLLMTVLLLSFVFFKQMTAYEMRISYWTSDVCSSDLARGGERRGAFSRRPSFRDDEHDRHDRPQSRRRFQRGGCLQLAEEGRSLYPPAGGGGGD